MWLSVLSNQSKLYLSMYNILCLFDWLISSVGVHEMWLSVLINQSKLYLVGIIYIFVLIG